MSESRPFYEFTGPEAKKLADLNGISTDLECVKSHLETMRDPEISDESMIRKACLMATLITYRRCFKSNIRPGLTRDDIVALPHNAIEIHDYLMDQANKFAAHSVNRFEQSKVGLMVENDKVIGVGHGTFILEKFNKDNIEVCLRLVNMIINEIISPRMKSARQAVMKAANKLPIEEITKANTIAFTPATLDEAGKPRR